MSACRICQKNKIILLLKINKFPKHIWPRRKHIIQKYISLEVFGCKNCGTIQLGNLNQKFITSLYKKNIFLLNTSTSFKSIIYKNKLFIDFIYDKMGKNFLYNKNILDVGGFDFFLSQNLNYKKVFICDPNTPTNITKGKKIKIVRKFFSKKLFNKSSIDIVVAKHILEHIKDLSTFLKDISYILKDNGCICVEVPNLTYGISSQNHSFFYHQHLTYFDKSSLKNLLSRNGFKVLFIKQEKNIIRAIAIKQQHIFKIIRPNLKNFSYLKNFKKMLNEKEKKIIMKIDSLDKIGVIKNKNFYIYGAGGSATIFLSLFKKISKKIIGIIDGNKIKENLNIGENNYKVLYNKTFFRKNTKDIIVFILSDEFYNEIKKDILLMHLPYNVQIISLYPKTNLQNISRINRL